MRLVVRRCYVMGITLIPIPPVLPHHPRGAICASVETFTDTFVKGMVIVRPGVVGEWWRRKWWLWQLVVFLLIFASFEVWVYCVPARLKKVEKFWQERTCWTP